MRSIDEVRARTLDELTSMIERCGMWAGSGRSMQTLAQGAISDLCFIDERDDEFSNRCEELYRYGKRGVVGAFAAVFGDKCDYAAEVASVFARMAVDLGYVELNRRLSEFEWRSLIATVRDRYHEADLRRSVVLDDLGEPSLVVGERVLCYAGPSTEEWAAFDCWEASVTRYLTAEEAGPHTRGNFLTQRTDDPLLRDVRLPAPSFDEGLVLTIYGKVTRWGPGWWLRTEPVRDVGTPPGIREQLRAIDADDPSESLGLRRP